MSKSVTNSYEWSTVSANYGLWVAGQAGINLSAVQADLVIVKATQGTTYVSPEADTQYQGAKSAGRLLGVYHFATGDGAVEEAKFFLSNVKHCKSTFCNNSSTGYVEQHP
ncbi:hypothetical protein H7R52_07040 [Weissella confusa]|uniref:Lysozyme n=1 Tax=Weissella confusa TaxID=1583 RepID=A0A923SSZ6_WEICO|nr:hypothetical protein [Weissella confusa]